MNAVTAPSAQYEVCGRRLDMDSPGFATAIAQAHAARWHPICLCAGKGVEMYVARLGCGYIVKRMPETGAHHAPDCASYEPPASFSGLGQVLGSAIIEDPATGQTTLKLGFALSKGSGRDATPLTAGEGSSVLTDGVRLSLRGLLHFLWDQSGLTRWQPGFAGKRSWATVRKHLLEAANAMTARGEALRSRIYVPEIFAVEQREAINAGRLLHWTYAIRSPGRLQHLLLMIAEVKELAPSRYGRKLVVKHIPDQAFAVDEQLYRRLERRFLPELTLWGTSDSIHMVLAGTFGVSSTGAPTVHEMSLMPTTAQWLPIEDGFDRALIDRLVREGRSFRRALRFDEDSKTAIHFGMLLDCGPQPIGLYIKRPKAESIDMYVSCAERSWTWDPTAEAMPELPQRPRREREAPPV